MLYVLLFSFFPFLFDTECTIVVPICFTTHRKNLWKNFDRLVLLLALCPYFRLLNSRLSIFDLSATMIKKSISFFLQILKVLLLNN